MKQPEADRDCAILAMPEKPARPRPRLSMVVLPFINLSDDREQQYFADAMTEDLTTDLSRIPGMFVISRNTAFTYRNKPVDAKQIGRELGVGYVLEGSVRRSDDHVRVNAQLIDAETAAHLWAERFDGDTGNLFALQNEVTSRIAVALNLELVDAEAARPTEHRDALDYILRGRAAMQKPLACDSHAEAIGIYERALALDPRSVALHQQDVWPDRARASGAIAHRRGDPLVREGDPRQSGALGSSRLPRLRPRSQRRGRPRRRGTRRSQAAEQR
jgi:TolB-like protein